MKTRLQLLLNELRVAETALARAQRWHLDAALQEVSKRFLSHLHGHYEREHAMKLDEDDDVEYRRAAEKAEKQRDLLMAAEARLHNAWASLEEYLLAEQAAKQAIATT